MLDECLKRIHMDMQIKVVEQREREQPRAVAAHRQPAVSSRVEVLHIKF